MIVLEQPVLSAIGSIMDMVTTLAKARGLDRFNEIVDRRLLFDGLVWKGLGISENVLEYFLRWTPDNRLELRVRMYGTEEDGRLIAAFTTSLGIGCVSGCICRCIEDYSNYRLYYKED